MPFFSFLVVLARADHDSAAAAGSPPAVFNFGDSNSDTGELATGLGFRLASPYGHTFFQNNTTTNSNTSSTGRFCDGRLIVDFLMDAMDLPFLNPYLDSVGSPNFQRGCNFAAGGSTIMPATAASISPFSFQRQVSQFFRFKTRVLELLGGKVDQFLPQEEYFNKGLYMFDIGQNDLAGRFYSKSEEEVIASIPTILSEFETGLRLHALCKKLQGDFVDANITYVDVFSIKLGLIANSSTYGFNHPTTACCGYGGPPANYDSRVTCGQTKNLNGSLVTAQVCDKVNEYINWDGIHYTEAANRAVALQILAGKYSNSAFSSKMPVVPKFKN
ncbi:hypothetical protein ACLOJK_018666 [Asimina triloba]